MKKIVLIGDSIRMGYDKYVKEALANTAEVYYPAENSQYAENVLRFAHEWIDKSGFGSDVDLIHWNAGLWDCLELFGDEPLTSLQYYGEAIFRIHKRLRLIFPKAKIVFATSTAVIEGKAKELIRHNNIIRLFPVYPDSVKLYTHNCSCFSKGNKRYYPHFKPFGKAHKILL